MARLIIILAFLTHTIVVASAVAADAPSASLKPSVLTPYAAAPPDSSDAEDPTIDGFDDIDAAPIGAPSSSDIYPPIKSESNAATIIGVSSVATASIIGLAGYLVF